MGDDETQQINVRITRQRAQQLSLIAQLEGTTNGALVEEALECLIAQRRKSKTWRDTLQAHFDMQRELLG